jgi:Tol biopolymer transport system component
VVLVGCGRIAFDPRSDVAANDGPLSCGPFSAPVPLPGPVQTPGDDWFPTPTPDQLELYYYRYNGSSDADVVRATRPTTADMFSASSPVAELNTTDDDTSVSTTDDQLDLVMTHFTTGASHLYSATRAQRTDPWSAPSLFTTLLAPQNDTNPWLSPDGLRVTFVSVRSGSAFDLYESTRATRTDSWTPPITLSVSLVGVSENDPTESADGLELFFTSTRNEVGNYDVYRATRPTVDDPFGSPVLVPELSSTGDDVGPRLSRDGRTIYLAYNTARLGGQNAAIYTATRVCN